MELQFLPVVVGFGMMLSSCTGGGINAQASPFNQMLRTEDLELTKVIGLEEFKEIAIKHLVFKPVEFLKENNISIANEGNPNAYFNSYELLNVCGIDCNPNEGLGQVLREFVVDRSK